MSAVPSTGTPGLRLARWCWVAGVFAPPLMLTALHEWLATEAEALPAAMPLQVVRSVSSWWELAQPWLLGLMAVMASVALLVRLRRRLSWTRLRLPLLLAWWLLCGAGAWAVGATHADRAGLTPGSEVYAKVLGVAHKTPSQRGPGGVVVFLQAPAWQGPRSLLLEGTSVTSVAPGAGLLLQTARGARGGMYVTAWSRVEPAPALTVAAPTAR